MATEATAAATTQTADPAQTAPEAAQAAAQQAKTEPVAPAQPGPKLSAQARAAAAIAKMEAASAAAAEKPAEAAAKVEGEKPAEAAKPEDKQPEKAAEGEKKTEEKQPEPLSRAMAIIAQKDAQLAKDRRAFAEERAAHERAVAADKTDLDFVRQARDVYAKQGKIGIMRMFAKDLSMQEIVDWQSRQGEPDPREIAREVAQAELKAVEDARKAAEEKAKADAAERDRAADIARGTDFNGRADVILTAEPGSFPLLLDQLQTKLVTPDQFWAFTKQMEQRLGREPTPREALEAAEKQLRANVERMSGKISPKPADPAPATATTQAATKQPEKAPAQQPARPTQKRESAVERASRLARERRLS